MLYAISTRMLVSHVLPLDFSGQKKGESDRHYNKRVKETEELLEIGIKKCRMIGYKAFLRANHMTEKGMCEYFTKAIPSVMPITQLIVEN